MNLPTNKATMSSREIAELTGKRHSHLMRDIRNMEPAWEKVTKSKFGLSEYSDRTGRKLPMFELNKKECLYVATKFNDEARARLILRWEELEKQQLSTKRKHNRLTQDRLVDLLADVCRIDDKDIRLSITDKLLGGRE